MCSSAGNTDSVTSKPKYLPVDLPTEIIFEIFEFLALSLDESGSKEEPNTTWSSCALVCRSWYPVARQLQFVALELRLGIDSDTAVLDRFERTVSVFEANPSLARFITAICITGTHRGYSRTDPETVKNLVKAFELLASLDLDPDKFTHFELSFISFASWRFSPLPTRQALSSGIANVMQVARRLKLDDVGFRSPEDFSRMLRLGQEHRLSQVDIRMVYSAAARHHEATLLRNDQVASSGPDTSDGSLEMLSMREFGTGRLSALGPLPTVLTSQDGYRLRNLHTLNVMWAPQLHKDFLSLFEHIGPSLVALKLVITDARYYAPFSSNRPAGLSSFWEYIPFCPALEKISVIFRTLLYGGTYVQRSSADLRHLLDAFSSENVLSSLYFEWALGSHALWDVPGWAALDEIMANEERFPCISMVHVAARMKDEDPDGHVARLINGRFPKLQEMGKFRASVYV